MERVMNIKGARVKAERPTGKAWPKPKKKMKVALGSARAKSIGREEEVGTQLRDNNVRAGGA